MSISKFIYNLFLDLLKALTVAILFYCATKQVDTTYYVALGSCIGFIIYDTIKAIGSINIEKTQNNKE